MNILIIGKGGREHAFIKALSGSASVKQIFVLPGRAGFEPEAICVPTNFLEKEKIKLFVKENKIELVIFGGETELASGWSDFFRSLNIWVFGPSREASQLESSKLFAKLFMSRANIPTASFREIDSIQAALNSSSEFGFPVVLKADGLAGGKGVFICQSLEELKKSAELIFKKKIFGSNGHKALLETFQKGEELSVFVLTNGSEYTILPFARDYKKLREKNQGPNTGGMGAFAPYEVSSTLQEKIETKIVKPSMQALKENNLFYRGVLYIGLMITNDEPSVLEYNIRFGDPEAQVLLPLLEGDLAQIFLSIAKGKVPKISWKKDLYLTCVVLAAEGYPFQPLSGAFIEVDLSVESSESYFLQAGTEKRNKGWFVAGGRVLNAIGKGASREEATRRAYTQAQRVYWPGIQKRSDIGG